MDRLGRGAAGAETSKLAMVAHDGDNLAGLPAQEQTILAGRADFSAAAVLIAGAGLLIALLDPINLDFRAWPIETLLFSAAAIVLV